MDHEVYGPDVQVHHKAFPYHYFMVRICFMMGNTILWLGL